jgi:CHAD domain-containing protein
MTVESYRSAMRSLIGERWEDVWKAVPRAVEGADIEGVHDVRVASRRLRAAMDVAAPAFPPSWYKPLLDAAKEITSELGAVRDRDVMIDYLIDARGDAPPNERPGIDRLIERVERERTAARNEMETYLQKLAEQGLRDETRRRFPIEQPAAKTR